MTGAFTSILLSFIFIFDKWLCLVSCDIIGKVKYLLTKPRIYYQNILKIDGCCLVNRDIIICGISTSPPQEEENRPICSNFRSDES